MIVFNFNYWSSSMAEILSLGSVIEFFQVWDKAFELKTIQYCFDEIEEPFKKNLFDGKLLLFNPQDVEHVINGCENWLTVIDNTGGIQLHIEMIIMNKKKDEMRIYHQNQIILDEYMTI